MGLDLNINNPRQPCKLPTLCSVKATERKRGLDVAILAGMEVAAGEVVTPLPNCESLFKKDRSSIIFSIVLFDKAHHHCKIC